MLRRETIIALRARHTAFRIAIEILHPQQPPPPAAQPAMPVLEDGEQAIEDWQFAVRARVEWERQQQRSRRIAWAVIVGGLLLLYGYGVWSASSPPSPPPAPPQARPILPTQ
jgi:hypothetical protein